MQSQPKNTFTFKTKLINIKTKQHKDLISKTTGLPKTPNNVVLYGNLQALLKHQKNVSKISPRINQFFPKILKIYRSKADKVVFSIEDTSHLNPSDFKHEILQIYDYFHNVAELPICLPDLKEFWRWPLSISTYYGLLLRKRVCLELKTGAEAELYNKLEVLPPLDALKRLDLSVLAAFFNVEVEIDPRKRKSLDDLKRLGDSLDETENSPTETKCPFRIPELTRPLERVPKSKLWTLHVKTEGGLASLLLKHSLSEDIPGLVTAKKSQKSIFTPKIVIKDVNCSFIENENSWPLLGEWNLPKKLDSGGFRTPTITSPRFDSENDFKQLMVFTQICNAYPFTKPRLLQELDKQTCPDIVRPEIWKCLLDIKPNFSIGNKSKKIDEAMSRQLDVDIPRCHQYNNTMSSPNGQSIAKTVLSTWIIDNSERLTYWQGLDSLCAPFVVLFVEDENVIYQAFSNFIEKLLPDMFQPDNSKVITRYLGLLEQLLNFFNPKLGAHFQNIGFSANLYAVPWFLTMFSHVVSINKIYVLWDKLLIKTSSEAPEAGRIFQVYIAVAMLSLIDRELCSYDFNGCCQWSSDMQDFDIYKIVQIAEEMFEKSPLSVGTWDDERSIEQPVPFIRISRLQQSNIISDQSSFSVNQFRNTYAIVDTRDPVRHKSVSLKFSNNIPFDEEFDFGASFIEFKSQTIVLVGDFEVNSMLSLQLISLHIKHVCILYEDIEDEQVQIKFKNMLQFVN